MKISNRAQMLIRSVEKHGLYFDEIESCKGALRFFMNPPYGAIYFSSWTELQNWLRGLCD